MRYVSLFSGVEAATVAWSHLGWEPLAFAEIDEFPSAVLAARFPNVPNLGDVCKVDWEEFYGRFTPTECERLQAFPDGWTDLTGCDVDAITEKVAGSLGYEPESREWKSLRTKVSKWSNGTPDTPRYKAMGNSMTTYAIEILGRRIQAYDELHYDEVGQ